MAIQIKNTYSGRTDNTDPNYPYGKGRNVVGGVEGTGTPFEADWYNNLEGFLQGLLLEAGVTPDGDVDNANSSQLVEAVKGLGKSADKVITSDGRNVQERLDDLPSEVDAAGTAATLISQHNSDATAHPELSAFITAEADRAENAASNSVINAELYDDTTEGIGSTVEGEQFQVLSGDLTEYIRYSHDAGSVAREIGRYPSAKAVNDIDERIEDQPISDISYAITDEKGNAIISIDLEGNRTENYGDIEITSKDIEGSNFKWAITDNEGNVALGVTDEGQVVFNKAEEEEGEEEVITSLRTFDLNSCDTIVHVGDSYTEGNYNLKDKHYVGQLSALSPFRHVNFGRSGDEALDESNRIINLSTITGEKFKDVGAKYAFITTLTNDGIFRNSDLSYYMENIRRLVDTVKAEGVEPIITTEFPATSTEHSLLKQVASEYSIGFVDCTSINRELGGLDVGPFFQGHPGIRTNGVFWLPIYEYVSKHLSNPEKSIKIFRKREGYTVSTISDLLYKDNFDLSSKFKEISGQHRHIDPWFMYDSLSPIDYSFITQKDEYDIVKNGESITLTDYSLIKVNTPVNAVTGEKIVIELGLTSGLTVYVRDYLNPDDAIDGRRDGATATDTQYLADYNKPRGSWRAVTITDSALTLEKNELRNSMYGNEIQLLIVGSGSLSDIKVGYLGEDANFKKYTDDLKVIGGNLVSEPFCGNATQLGNWSITGSPVTLEPIDNSMSPRKTDGTPVDGVCVVTNNDKIAQSIILQDDEGRVRKYEITIWCRYFPKAFLDPNVYTGLDPNQVIDRVTNPNDSEVTEDTFDLRTLKVETWFGTSKPSNGGNDLTDFVAMCWRPVKFMVESLPYQSGDILNFELSCTDGEIQIAKTLINEVI